MSAISTYLQRILNAIWARDVRQAIHDAISQCYDDVNAPALQTEAMQAAVQAKIDAGEMAALIIGDGTITSEKFADNVIDDTLTLAGSAADAKAVGDSYDIAIFDKLEFTSEWNIGGIAENGRPIDSGIRIRSVYIPVAPKQKIVITPQEGVKIKIVFYTRQSYNSFYKVDGEWTAGDTPRMIINDGEQYYIRVLGGYENDNTISQTADVSEMIHINTYTYKDFVRYETFYGSVYGDVPVAIHDNNNYYWNIETEVAVKTQISTNFHASDPISITPGDVYTLTARQGSTEKARMWVITDDDYNIITMCESYYGTAAYTVTFTVPEGGTLLLLTNQGSINIQKLYKKTSAIDILNDYINEKPLSGKKMSLLGDSISALAGTIPEGNAAYYSGSNHGITSASQMWWSVLCEETGMTPCIINGWSGSGINWQTDSSHMNIVPMSDDTRCGGLHDDTNMPDVILIAGGVNDYTYAQYAQNEPLEWDGKSVPNYTEPETGKQIYSSFTTAYAATIKKLQTNYPNAIIVALSTWFTMRGDDNGYTLTHAVGDNVYTQQDYNDKIRYVAEQMHIPYIDVSNIGFNRNNFYPIYASDSATIPTHPTAAGHAVMGKAIAAKLIDAIKGFM